MGTRLAAAAAELAALTGCASFNQLSSEVSSYGQWPAGRSPGQYFIERLPSQAARNAPADRPQPLEQAAHQALQRAGFKPAADLASADVVVQIGARVTRYEVAPWADPLWWRWGPRYWHGPTWPGTYRGFGPSVYWRAAPPPDREVAVLLRDRATSVPLWEARATSTGFASDVSVFEAMFAAALSDFPNARPEMHRVAIPLTR